MPPELAAAIDAGAQFSMRQGPAIETTPDHYESLVELLLDGDVVGHAVLRWEAEPPRPSGLACYTLPSGARHHWWCAGFCVWAAVNAALAVAAGIANARAHRYGAAAGMGALLALNVAGFEFWRRRLRRAWRRIRPAASASARRRQRG